MPDDPRVVSVNDESEAIALVARGATLERHAHLMRLPLPAPTYDDPELRAFGDDASPPVPWVEVLPAFLAAYPPDHPDYLPGGSDLIDSHLIAYTAGAKLGPLICPASAIAVTARQAGHSDTVAPDRHAYGGILIVDRPGEGAWVCDIWRDPDRRYAGAGTRLLRWAASRLGDYDSLGLVVTVGNDAALRAYERVGFVVESTGWRLRLPD